MILQYNHRLNQEKMDMTQNEIDKTVNFIKNNSENQNLCAKEERSHFLIPNTIPSQCVGETKYKIKQNRETKCKTNRLKCKDFNDIISCYICKGYLINPTTITIENCFHSFCRSCIVNHILNLSDRAFCPKCGKGSKPIKFLNLKSDETLKSIVYKLIPGLHHKEIKRCLNFNTDKNIVKSHDLRELEDEDFYAPGEPISLSLEYHPKALGKDISKDLLPPIRYLQCPAALTIHHLARFLCTKFDINIENQRVNIEIIYEDEILSNDFTLMDVCYCYKWNRLAPMKFYYQILVYNERKDVSQIEKNIVNRINDKDTEAKYSKTNEAVAKKSVKFKSVEGKAVENKFINNRTLVSNTETKCKIISDKEKSFNFIDNESEYKNEIENDKTNFKNNNISKNYINNNNNTVLTNNNNNNNNIDDSILKEKIKKPLNNNTLDNNYKELEDIKTIRNDNEIVKDKEEAELFKSSKQEESDENPLKNSTNSVANNDFKSLRSNNEFQSQTQLSLNSTVIKNKTTSPKLKEKTNKISSIEANHQKLVSKCDIVVSIPQNHIHRASNSSDDSFENLSLAQLKTANKKNSNAISPREISYNQKLSEALNNCEQENQNSKLLKNKEKDKLTIRNENESEEIEKEKEDEKEKDESNKKYDPLKVKIEKNSFKTKLTLSSKKPTTANEKPDTKKFSKIERKFSTEDVLPNSNEVDLTTYAKVIGLKPIKPINEEKKELIMKQSPDASPASATSSCSSTASFNFLSEVSSSSSHKKRKKAKHNKELKKRKLHAEIASESVDQPEGIKLKVKITPSHKSHKNEKKPINNDSLNEIETQNKIKDSTDSTAIPEKSPEVIDNDSKTSEKINSENKPEVIEIEQPKVNETNHIPTTNEIMEEKIKSEEQNIAKPHQFVNSNKTKKQNFIPKTIVSANSHLKFPSSLNNTLIKSSQLSSPQTGNCLKQTTQKVSATSQDSKLPISPPLPPSLFKTTTLNLPKHNLNVNAVNTQKNISLPHRQSMSQHQQMAMNHMNRITSKNSSRNGTAANFIVPNPPRGIVSNAAKHFPIGSIASQQHRQAAQLKRSASLDSSPPTFAKQLKLEQDRLIRKSAYASKLTNPTLSIANNLQANQQNVLLPVTTQQIINRNSPTAVVFSSVPTNKSQQEQIFYTTAMGTSYTHENASKKSVPILLPPSSISVTKMVDTFPNSIITSPSGLTITPQDQQPPAFQYQNTNKPALEIVRIQSNIPPIDQQTFPITNNNTVKQTANKASRPPPPPIPLKIKKPTNQSPPTQPTISNVPPSIPQNAQLVNINQMNSNKTENTENKPIEILDLSGKSRSPSREKSSSPEVQTATQDILQNNAVNLEAAITQLLQQQNHVTSSSNLISQPNKSPNQDENVGLQNLQMLSESATNREKLAVKTNRAVPLLSKLDVGKIRASANVRQQNASIRNIPNPSALAFRGNQQPPLPMLANISKITQQKLNINVNENIPKTQALSSNINTTTMSPTTTTTSADSSKVIASKKNLEQLAQNLAQNALNNLKTNATNSNTINSLVTSTTTENKSNSVSSSNFNVSSSSQSVSTNIV
ncbi:protein suppressor 2 of zeste [Condylostylus longicornis]|uniref:protein suppressor 2 of zeste n=1 Tax=Condylostylus longicornis TaxID=2530218 RepID=UPI00244E2980|nr:protein suppressor 2 of zeste [Condylostylus longicornis]XP_055374398.1 protein suppressor 2 of zeste [Condylostylus longicornis]XP_055374399.1 protein suppressor 2 of zeste [Condylostylus longicornis]XP_055374400.1 protein suppressor 2 of zeste [Condylostylus longicornis]